MEKKKLTDTELITLNFYEVYDSEDLTNSYIGIIEGSISIKYPRGTKTKVAPSFITLTTKEYKITALQDNTKIVRIKYEA